MTAITEAHLNKLNDADRRTLALRILNDAVSAFDTSIEEHGLTNHPTLDPAPVHDAADWLHEILTNPDDGYADETLLRHRKAVYDFLNAAYDIGEATAGDGDEFRPKLNADAVKWVFYSVYHDGGTPHRPSAWWLYTALDRRGGGFIPVHDTPAGYVLKALCDSNDPRLPALAESYLQSGLHVNLRPAINRATRQLAHLDDLTELNR